MTLYLSKSSQRLINMQRSTTVLNYYKKKKSKKMDEEEKSSSSSSEDYDNMDSEKEAKILCKIQMLSEQFE